MPSTMRRLAVIVAVFLSVVLAPAWSSLQSGSSPEINEDPLDQSVARGSPATLNCIAYGQPSPKITWYKDGRELQLSPEEHDHFMMLPDGALFFLRTVQNSKTQDSGLYHCKAENIHGVVFSKKARLTVTYLKSKFGEVGTSRDIVVEEGEELRLPCHPPEGNPHPTVYWEKDGHLVNPAAYNTANRDQFGLEKTRLGGSAPSISHLYLDPMAGSSDGGVDLVITAAQMKDEGTYVCLATIGTTSLMGGSSAGGNSDLSSTLRRDAPFRVRINRRAAVVVVSSAGRNDAGGSRSENPSTAPQVTETRLLDRLTGLVAWLPPASQRHDASQIAGYLVTLSAVNKADADTMTWNVESDYDEDNMDDEVSGKNRKPMVVTNITVEPDVNQVKLHSLDPSLAYRVQVAALYATVFGSGNLDSNTDQIVMVGPYSQPPRLIGQPLLTGREDMTTTSSTTTSHDIVLVKTAADSNDGSVRSTHTEAANGEGGTEIPLKVWAIAMAVVIVVTLAIVLAAGLLCYKSHRHHNHHHHAASGKWLDAGGGTNIVADMPAAPPQFYESYNEYLGRRAANQKSYLSAFAVGKNSAADSGNSSNSGGGSVHYGYAEGGWCAAGGPLLSQQQAQGSGSLRQGRKYGDPVRGDCSEVQGLVDELVHQHRQPLPDGHFDEDEDEDSPTTSFRSNNRLIASSPSSSPQGQAVSSAPTYDYAFLPVVAPGETGETAGHRYQAGGSMAMMKPPGFNNNNNLSGQPGHHLPPPQHRPPGIRKQQQPHSSPVANHYASNTILKPTYYEPFQTASAVGGSKSGGFSSGSTSSAGSTGSDAAGGSRSRSGGNKKHNRKGRHNNSQRGSQRGVPHNTADTSLDSSNDYKSPQDHMVLPGI